MVFWLLPAAALSDSCAYDCATLYEVVQLVLEQRTIRRWQLCDDVLSWSDEIGQHGLVTRQAFLQLLNTINSHENTHIYIHRSLIKFFFFKFAAPQWININWRNWNEFFVSLSEIFQPPHFHQLKANKCNSVLFYFILLHTHIHSKCVFLWLRYISIMLKTNRASALSWNELSQVSGPGWLDHKQSVLSTGVNRVKRASKTHCELITQTTSHLECGNERVSKRPG